MRMKVSAGLLALFLLLSFTLAHQDVLVLPPALQYADGDEIPDADDACPDLNGTSSVDRLGCPDSDADGYSDPDTNWTVANGADAFPARPDAWNDTDGDGWADETGLNISDAFPSRADAWSDADGDGFADQPNLNITDDCPLRRGFSTKILNGCSDIDYDLVPDIYDDDADGDGIRNVMERAASTGTILYDPFDAQSTPMDSDFDTIPDVLDDDNDNDGWPNELELERKSDPFDSEQTPLNMYAGFNTGTFYHGGLRFSSTYDEDSIEISFSWFLDILTGELVIPILLVPAYLYLYIKRGRRFRKLETLISVETDENRLAQLENDVNEMVRNKQVKVYHGLVLRNTIEAQEVLLRRNAILSNDVVFDPLPEVTELDKTGAEDNFAEGETDKS
jgi:hypothetical protein